MPKPESIEDAPHYLKLLVDYSKTAVTLSLALLSVSVAFADKVLVPPVDLVQALLIGLLWMCLLLALLSGLFITGQLTGVASNHMRALRIAYPDALEVIKLGVPVKVEDPSEEIKISEADKQDKIKKALEKSRSRTKSALRWANFSLWMFGLSSVLIILIGFYSSIYRGLRRDGSSAVESSVRFVSSEYKVPGDSAQLSALTYDEKEKSYVVEIRNKEATNEEYKVTINASSGAVTKAIKSMSSEVIKTPIVRGGDVQNDVVKDHNAGGRPKGTQSTMKKNRPRKAK